MAYQSYGDEPENGGGKLTNDVTATHAEYDANSPDWSLVGDAASGERAVKDGRETYLPKPNPTDKSKENSARYDQYLLRACYYNATGRTLQTMLGFAFAEDPAADLSGAISYALEDIDGAGVSIYQQSQMALSHVLKSGRAGLLVTYPVTDAPASVADMASGAIRASVALYPASSITNWRTVRVGSKNLMSMVVLRESHETPDEFATVAVGQYRVLRLSAAGYTQEIWRKKDKDEWAIVEGPSVVLDSSGSVWREIPFTFIGAVNNDPHCDPSPLYDIAAINLAHYRNSADYEESAYLVGQVQPWMAGLTVEWRDHLEKSGIYFGSRAPIMLPEGGSFGLAQAAANGMAHEAMMQKEAHMVALGARLLQPGGAVKTATQAQADNEAETSVLSLAAGNVSDAYTKALAWMAQFMGSGTGEYRINQDYGIGRIDAQMLTSMLAAVQAGKMPDADFWAALRGSGLIEPSRTDEMLREELDASAGGGLLLPAA